MSEVILRKRLSRLLAEFGAATDPPRDDVSLAVSTGVQFWRAESSIVGHVYRLCAQENVSRPAIPGTHYPTGIHAGLNSSSYSSLRDRSHLVERTLQRLAMKMES